MYYSIIMALAMVFVPGVSPLSVSAAEAPVWIEATGEAQMGEIDTLMEVKQRAKRDAQIKAVEKAVGIFIKSHTLVSNNQVAEDLVYASVRGVIEKVEIISEGWDEQDRNRYRVGLKALIKPMYPGNGQGLSVKLALSKSILKEGEEVKILYQANSDCYIYIFSISADGSVTLLLPNSMQQEHFITPNKAYEFPPAGSRIQLKAVFLPDFKGRSAEERIKIIATKEKGDLVTLGFQEGMFKAYDATSTGMISDLVKRLNQLEIGDWAEAAAVYRLERE
jgi:Domain of unknown function (DUF4384)